MTKIDFDILILTECWLKYVGDLPITQNYLAHASTNNAT